MSDARQQEQKSAAVTLSDMELFIFPELMYSLVLANIMSPRIWRWRDDPWFDGLDRMRPYRRITRIKQYIMDHYIFNLDLDTWGLTTKARELDRFEGIIDADTLAHCKGLKLIGRRIDNSYAALAVDALKLGAHIMAQFCIKVRQGFIQEQ